VRVISFFEFIREHLPGLRFRKDAPVRNVALHEPCKTAYTGLDDSHRSVLNALPNITIREMESGVGCCGSGGISHFREETVRRITSRRLDEAEETGARTMVTVCHYCQELFSEERVSEKITVENLADILFEYLEF
jgi:Fe-S oxidoreductase